MAGLESLPGPMRSVCGGRQGLVCRGVVGPRRSRAAEQSGVGWRLGLEAALARGMGSWGSAGGLKGNDQRSRGPAREGRPRWFRPGISAGPLGTR